MFVIQVTCQICKKKIEKEEAYKVTVDGINKYYCSKIEFNKKQQEKAEKEAVYNEIVNIFGYKIINSALWKEWKEWNCLADNKTILNYIQENKEYIKFSMNRATGKEFARIRYFSAILKNSLRDYTEKKEQPKQVEIKKDIRDTDFVFFEPVKEERKTRRSFAELEESYE